MKNVKRIAGIALALILALALAVPAFAAANGTITINDAQAGHTYSVYRVLDLTYDAGANAYSYKVNSAWTDFFKAGTGALDYVSVSNGYVTWTNADNADDGAAVKAFAELAMAWAEDNGVAATGSKEAESATVEFTGLELGYYLVDSTVGALCGLTTTNPDASINAKNGIM